MKEIMKTFTFYAFVLMFVSGITDAFCKENASNPLAVVGHTDLRWQYKDLGGPERNDFYLDGAVMLSPRLKLKYELHYWDTDKSGTWQNDWESLRLTPIYFPTKGKWGSWKYKLGIGAELIEDFGNEDKGIGSGSDEIAPAVAVELRRGDTVLTPRVQHYVEYDGPNVNKTEFRLTAFQSLPNKYWCKLEPKITVDWADDNAIPATLKVELGKMFLPLFGTYVDGLLGIGGDRSYDWGFGIGLRFHYQ